jgi:hypothetical protein
MSVEVTDLSASGFRPVGAPSPEISRNSPMTAQADQLVTELYLAIA